MYLDDRALRVVEILLLSEEYVSMDSIASKLKVSKRTIYNDMDSIIDTLSRHNIGVIQQVRGLGYRLNETQKKEIKILLEGNVSYQIVDPENRVHLIYCVFLGFNSKVDIDSLMNLTGVSRNTLFSDLKLIRTRMERYNLVLDYTPKLGYQVLGDLIQKRSLFMYHYIPLISSVKDKSMIEDFFINNQTEFEAVLSKLDIIEETIKTEYIDGTLYNLAVLMSVKKLHEDEDVSNIDSIEEVIESVEYKTLRSLLPQLSDFNALYYAIHLLGSMKQIKSYNPKAFQFTDIAIEMVEKFQTLSAIEFTQVTLLVSNLSNHLSISMYRYKFGLHLSNPLLSQIKTQYENVFNICNQVCDILRNTLHVLVSDSEVAYITLHFNSFIRRNNYHETSDDILIVCPQGISTSAMLKKEIETINPMLNIAETLSLKQFEKKEAMINSKFIISTVDLPTNRKYLKVNAVLSQSDRNLLQRHFALETESKQQISADKIMEIVSPYISDRDYDLLHKDLENYFINLVSRKHDKDLSLNDVLTPLMVQIVPEVASWQEGIEISCCILKNNGYIDDNYSKAVIKATEKFGPYMVLENGYMLAHASINDGVNALGLSFTKFNVPFHIDGKKVNKIFTLSPVDQKQHLKIMGDLLSLFTQEDLHVRIDMLFDKEEIHRLIIDNI